MLGDGLLPVTRLNRARLIYAAVANCEAPARGHAEHGYRPDHLSGSSCLALSLCRLLPSSCDRNCLGQIADVDVAGRPILPTNPPHQVREHVLDDAEPILATHTIASSQASSSHFCKSLNRVRRGAPWRQATYRDISAGLIFGNWMFRGKDQPRICGRTFYPAHRGGLAPPARSAVWRELIHRLQPTTAARVVPCGRLSEHGEPVSVLGVVVAQLLRGSAPPVVVRDCS